MRSRHHLWLTRSRHGLWLIADGLGKMGRPMTIAISHVPLVLTLIACGGSAPSPQPAARNVLLITVDTLRADHVGAYGYARARTPTLDALARGGAQFDRAFAAAPITLPSHATLLTGRYPPGHGSRDNGVNVAAGVPTLAEAFKARGFATAAFVAAFPLDRQFGLHRGFDVYGDRLPRGADGRQANERPAPQVVDEAIAWLQKTALSPQRPASSPQPPFFLWVHFFDPHAPYGDPSSGRSAIDRYDDEIATVDREAGRLIEALGPARAQTLAVATADHGEAFGEHGEYAHSIFVYDTTLRVPLVINGPGVRAGARIGDAVTLADVAPTVMRLAGGSMADVDGIDLSAAIGGAPIARRELYAESFAPLLEFGWAPLRAIRSGTWKFIAAPKPELFDLERDPGEQQNVAAAQPSVAGDLAARTARYSTAQMPAIRLVDAGSADRLRALGYSAGSPSAIGNQPSANSRADPKDRREIAARIAQVTSGELSGAPLTAALEQILAVDARNSQAHLRLGFQRLQAGDCVRAEQEFIHAINGGLPSADAHLGLATCLGRRNDLAGAERALKEAQAREPDNPVVTANRGLMQSAQGDLAGAIRSLETALAADPDLHEARFNLALAYAKSGRRADATAAARDLLVRLPSGAPQRAEVERLLRAVQ
jgi:choline-sulfatase